MNLHLSAFLSFLRRIKNQIKNATVPINPAPPNENRKISFLYILLYNGSTFSGSKQFVLLGSIVISTLLPIIDL